MITKTAAELTKESYAVDALVGGYRASKLSDKEKKALKKKYKLEEDSNLASRNAGRGMAGATAGVGIGSIAGGLAGLAASRKGSELRPLIAALGGSAGALSGNIIGTAKATEKYSKGNAEKIIKGRKEK